MRNDIIHGDCLEVLLSMEDQSVSLVIDDLPYGITRNDWDVKINLQKYWSRLKRVLKPNACVIMFGQGAFTTELITANIEWYKYSLIWHKTLPVGFLNANKRPLSAHEDIAVFYKGTPTYNPVKSKGHVRSIKKPNNQKLKGNYGSYHKRKGYESTERYPTSVLTFSKGKIKNQAHPTQKPIALIQYLIELYSNKGDLVLDNCCGSGTTAIAAHNSGRDFVCIEKNQEYYKKAKQRFVKHVGLWYL